MGYHQITPEERYTLAAFRTQYPVLSITEIASKMSRSTSTISRELRRNATPYDQAYRPSRAQEQANGRRSRTRRWSKLSAHDWGIVEELLEHHLSPEQISGWLRKHDLFRVSHETIYKYIWADKHAHGVLHRLLRQKTKKHRKRYATTERRGVLPGKRHISERPLEVEPRQELGHWEIDTIHGAGRESVVTLVERASGVVLIGWIPNLTVAALNKRVIAMIRKFERKYGPSFKTITADNGTEFHGYKEIERRTGAIFYFATPYHSWERGTNENTNGLIRQYLPKRSSMADVTQADCDAIALRLNHRPRKRYGFIAPLEQFAERRSSAG